MNKIAGGIAAIAALIGAPAFAADMAVKAPPPAPAPVYSWTGWYVGGNLGYSWGRANNNYIEPGFSGSLSPSIPGSQNVDGIIGGAQIGYNWQANSIWVLGLETDFQGSGERGSSSFFDPYFYFSSTPNGSISGTRESTILWFGTIRGRVGALLNPTTLLYATGGLAYGRIKASGSFTDTYLGSFYNAWSFGNSTTNVGWTIGAGIEAAIPNTNAWTWKVEYLYIDLGSVSGAGYDPGWPSSYSWSAKFTDNIVRVGLNYQFH